MEKKKDKELRLKSLYEDILSRRSRARTQAEAHEISGGKEMRDLLLTIEELAKDSIEKSLQKRPDNHDDMVTPVPLMIDNEKFALLDAGRPDEYSAKIEKKIDYEFSEEKMGQLIRKREMINAYFKPNGETSQSRNGFHSGDGSHRTKGGLLATW